MTVSLEELHQVPAVTSSSREGLVAWVHRLLEQQEMRSRECSKLKDEVNRLRAELGVEREARLSTEKEKKGLSLLDLLTRSGLTKSISIESSPDLVRLIQTALSRAIKDSIGAELVAELEESQEQD